jgi:hypothetical protein
MAMVSARMTLFAWAGYNRGLKNGFQAPSLLMRLEHKENQAMIRKTLLAFAMGGLSLAFAPIGFAQGGHYVLTNDNNNNTLTNTATLFRLDPTDGSLIQGTVLDTGEDSTGGYIGGTSLAITQHGACVFVADGSGSSSDVAAFSRATGYDKVGNYSNSVLQAAANSMVMVANTAGTILYVAYDGSSNLAVWRINSDCSLTLANTYPTVTFLDSMTITHDGSTLLAVFALHEMADSWAISGSTLTDKGAVTLLAASSGIVVTNDDLVVIMGTGYTTEKSNVITASLPGFTNQQEWLLGPGIGAGSLALSPDAAAGNGCLYVGNNGKLIGGGGASITGATFSENPVNVTYVNDAAAPAANVVANLALITNTGNGGGVYVAENPSTVGVFLASSDCSVTLEKENSDPQGADLLSIVPLIVP